MKDMTYLVSLVALWGALLYGTRFIRHKGRQEAAEAYLYILPAAAVLCMFWFFPVIFSVVVSLTDWTGAARLDSVEWVGLANYTKALWSRDFQQVLFNTMNFVIWSVPLTILLSLCIAMLLNSQMHGRNVFRTIYFLPYITTWVAIAIVFKYVFNESFGLANHFLHLMGIAPLGWLNEPRGVVEMALRDGLGLPLPQNMHPMLAGPSLAMFAVILTSVWRDTGYFTVIFLAGLQNIDKAYYEAAEIDGASPWQRFRNVTWPLLSPTTFFILIISMITAFKEFVPMFIMTPTRGPGRTTETLVFHLYATGFTGRRELGYASAVAYILFFIILMLTLLQNKFFGKKVHYD